MAQPMKQSFLLGQKYSIVSIDIPCFDSRCIHIYIGWPTVQCVTTTTEGFGHKLLRQLTSSSALLNDINTLQSTVQKILLLSAIW